MTPTPLSEAWEKSRRSPRWESQRRGDTIHCKMTRVEDVSYGKIGWTLQGACKGRVGGGWVWSPGALQGGCKGGVGMYQVEKLGEMARLLALNEP